MKLNLLKTIALSAVTAATASAEWTLIQNFDTGYDGFDLTKDNGGVAALELYADPADASNQVFYVESGNYGVTGYNTTFATATLPNPIPENASATVFFRYYQVGPSNNFHVAISDIAKTGTAPSGWGDMEAVFRTVLGEAGVRDASQYPLIGTGEDADSFVGFQPANGSWYDVWMVVENNEGIYNDIYTIYVSGGEFGDTVTHLKVQEKSQSDGSVLTGVLLDSPYFRNGTMDNLVTLIIATESGPVDVPFQGDKWYIDDIYITSGEDLTSPVASGETETWAGFEVRSDGWCLTAEGEKNFLGWVNVSKKPWIFSEALNGYIYLPEEYVRAGGCWSYVPR